MTIIVTPKSNAEVNQLVSVLDSASYVRIPTDYEATAFKVGVPAILFESFKEYDYTACSTLAEDMGIPVLTVNELGTFLQRS